MGGVTRGEKEKKRRSGRSVGERWIEREREQERDRGGQYVREGGNGKVSRERGRRGGGRERKGRETNSKQNCFFPINIDRRTK